MMINFARFWLDGNRFGEDADEVAAEAVPPGVTEGQILAWEREYGVTLPEPIRTALGRRNGGLVPPGRGRCRLVNS
jgi:cell wall assembly regulator SMI1